MELTQLAQLYQPGQTLWRVPLTHFTPGDYNWSFRAQRSAKKPVLPPNRNPKKPLRTKPKAENPSCKDGSEINVQSQILGESFPVANTPFFLHYSTDRTPGFADSRTIDVPLMGDSLPAGIQKIQLDIEVAGRRLRREFAPSANLSYKCSLDTPTPSGGEVWRKMMRRLSTGFGGAGQSVRHVRQRVTIPIRQRRTSSTSRRPMRTGRRV